MEMYYTKKEYNEMKSALIKENKRLNKQIAKLQKKIKELEQVPEFESTQIATEDSTPSVDFQESTN